MNENVENDIPVVDTGFDDDGFDDVADEIISEQKEESSSTTKDLESDTNADNQESSNKVDFKDTLDYLSNNVKYNKENVKVESMDDVITNYQKGLNYDKLQQQLEELKNGKALNYINTKAEELGLSVDEYMEQVINYEKEQQKQKDDARMQEMIENGVPEDVAREVIATSQLRKELQEEKNKLEKQKQEQEAKDKKSKEYDDFIKEFPDVKADEIPKEVFELANEKNIPLITAYKDHLYNEMKKELEQMKTNQKNKSSSIGSTQNYTESKGTGSSDLFLQGFDEA